MDDYRYKIASMLMRLEILTLEVSNEAYPAPEECDEWIPEVVHRILDQIGSVLNGLAVSRHEARLDREISAEFLASIIRLDEVDGIRQYLERREAEIAEFRKQFQ